MIQHGCGQVVDKVVRLSRGQQGRVSMFKCDDVNEPCFKRYEVKAKALSLGCFEKATA